MRFSDSAGKTGIVEDIDFLVNTDSTSYPIEQKTRNVNRRYDEVVSLILQADGRWKWDDTNNAAQPSTSITMTESTTAVAIPDTTYLIINRVEVKDANGNFYKLHPFNEHEVVDQSMTEFLKTPGRPLYYEKVGGFINLYPKPTSTNVTLTSGLKVYYQRDASYFTTADTTKVPGFAAPFHRILSFGGALDYAIQNEMTRKISIFSPIIQKMEEDLKIFYSSRSEDESPSIRFRKEDYGAGDGLSNYQSNSDKVAY